MWHKPEPVRFYSIDFNVRLSFLWNLSEFWILNEPCDSSPSLASPTPVIRIYSCLKTTLALRAVRLGGAANSLSNSLLSFCCLVSSFPSELRLAFATNSHSSTDSATKVTFWPPRTSCPLLICTASSLSPSAFYFLSILIKFLLSLKNQERVAQLRAIPCPLSNNFPYRFLGALTISL